MTGYRSAALAMTLGMLSAISVAACPIYIEPTLTDARQADAVVVGYVNRDVRQTSYARKARTQAPRNGHQGKGLAPYRTRLTIDVDHVIAGKASSKITVSWNQELNNGPPEHMRGGHLLALKKQPQTGGEGDVYAVMQGACSGALVFRRGSSEANAIRAMFGLSPEPLEEPRQISGRIRQSPIHWPNLIAYGTLIVGAALILLIVLWPKRRS